MLAAAVFLIVIAVVLSPGDEVPELSDEAKQAYYANAERQGAGVAADSEGDDGSEDEDDSEGADEDDDGIRDEAQPDPTTGKYKEH